MPVMRSPLCIAVDAREKGVQAQELLAVSRPVIQDLFGDHLVLSVFEEGDLHPRSVKGVVFPKARIEYIVTVEHEIGQSAKDIGRAKVRGLEHPFFKEGFVALLGAVAG